MKAEAVPRWTVSYISAGRRFFSSLRPRQHRCRSLGLLRSGPDPFHHDNDPAGQGLNVKSAGIHIRLLPPEGLDPAMKTVCSDRGRLTPRSSLCSNLFARCFLKGEHLFYLYIRRFSIFYHGQRVVFQI